jgi:hypothetical protein
MSITNRIGAGMVALALAFGAGSAEARTRTPRVAPATTSDVIVLGEDSVTSLAHQSPYAERRDSATARTCVAPMAPLGMLGNSNVYGAFCACADLGPRLDGSMVRVCAGRVVATWDTERVFIDQIENGEALLMSGEQTYYVKASRLPKGAREGQWITMRMETL